MHHYHRNKSHQNCWKLCKNLSGEPFMLSCWGKANSTRSKFSVRRERGIETRGRRGRRGLVDIPPLLSAFHGGFPAPLYPLLPNRIHFHWMGQAKAYMRKKGRTTNILLTISTFKSNSNVFFQRLLPARLMRGKS